MCMWHTCFWFQFQSNISYCLEFCLNAFEMCESFSTFMTSHWSLLTRHFLHATIYTTNLLVNLFINILEIIYYYDGSKSFSISSSGLQTIYYGQCSLVTMHLSFILQEYWKGFNIPEIPPNI